MEHDRAEQVQPQLLRPTMTLEVLKEHVKWKDGMEHGGAKEAQPPLRPTVTLEDVKQFKRQLEEESAIEVARWKKATAFEGPTPPPSTPPPSVLAAVRETTNRVQQDYAVDGDGADAPAAAGNAEGIVGCSSAGDDEASVGCSSADGSRAEQTDAKANAGATLTEAKKEIQWQPVAAKRQEGDTYMYCTYCNGGSGLPPVHLVAQGTWKCKLCALLVKLSDRSHGGLTERDALLLSAGLQVTLAAISRTPADSDVHFLHHSHYLMKMVPLEESSEVRER